MGTSTGAERCARRGAPAAVVLLVALLAACEESPATPGGDVVFYAVLNPPVWALAVGEQLQLDVIPLNHHARVVAAVTTGWTSSEPTIASVDSVGMVTGHREGTAHITASVSGIRASSVLQVEPAPLSEWREHSCFVTDVGAVWCWGRGGNGELGHGQRAGSLVPVRAPVPDAVTSVSVGVGHTCAATVSYTLYCWGRGLEGQLGNAASTINPTAVKVSDQAPYRLVSAGGRHTCALTYTDEPRCWGMADRGQLGNGYRINVNTPVLPEGGLRFARISAGARHTCAITSAGVAYCWGDNRAGQLGDGTLQDRAVPTPVQTPLRFIDISAGARHSCAVASDRRAWCWGDNGMGQLGTGDAVSSTVPRAMRSTAGMGLTRVHAGSAHTCGVDSRGGVYCWGSGRFGQLGNEGPVSLGTPARVQADTVAFTEVLVGAAHSCGVRITGAALCWGLNAFGQLGTGDLGDRSIPTAIAGSLKFRGAP